MNIRKIIREEIQSLSSNKIEESNKKNILENKKINN